MWHKLIYVLSALFLSGCIQTAQDKKRVEFCNMLLGEGKVAETYNPKRPFQSLKPFYASQGVDIAKKQVDEHHEMYSFAKYFQKCSHESYLHSDPEITKKRQSRAREIVESILSIYQAREKKIFSKRTGGRRECGTGYGTYHSINGIVLGVDRPDRKCLYRSASFMKAQQVLDKGVLARVGQTGYGSNVIFIYNKHGFLKDVADGNFLDDSRYFRYSGKYSYQSIAGKRTVHAFTPLKQNPYRGLFFIKPAGV